MSDVYEEVIKGGQIYHSVEVTKNTKGYNWVVKVAGADYEKVKERVVDAEKFCKEKYGSVE
jgi:hypothetical protein